MKYKITCDDEWVFVKRKGYRIMCCDCGLVHRFDFKLVPHVNGTGKLIAYRASLDRRATAAARRRKSLSIRLVQE